jgi:trigger factor
MKVEIKDISSCVRELKVEVPSEIVDREYENAYETLAKKVKIKGFRKGKVPRKILETYYKDTVEGDVIEGLISRSYIEVLKENEIKALGKPKIDNIDLKLNSPFCYTATVEILPEIEVKDYKGLEFTKKVVKVSDKDVDEELQRLRERLAKYEVNESMPAEKFDYVIIGYERFIDGVLDEEETKENLPVTIGYNMLYSDFEEKIVGMKKGEEKEIDITFPEDFQDKKIAGKEVKFKVKMKEVKKRILPELNDDFAREIGECNTIGELKDRIKEEMVKFEQQNAEARLKRGIIDKLVASNPIEIPPILLEEEIRLMFYDAQQRLRAQGVDLEDGALELEKIRENFKEPAVREVRGYLILDRISDLEGVAVSDEEVDERIKAMASSVNQDFPALKQKMVRLRTQMKRDKTLDILINQYKINEEMIEREEMLKEIEKERENR